MAVSALSLISEKLSLSNKLRSIAQCHQGTIFPCWSFSSLCLSDYLILSLFLAVSFLFLNLCIIPLSLFATFSTPSCAFSRYLIICLFVIYLLTFFPAPHSFLPRMHKQERLNAHLIWLCYKKLTDPLPPSQSCILLCDCSWIKASLKLVFTGGISLSHQNKKK